MRISDWSSDVCSSDLADVAVVDDFLQKLLEQHGSTPDVFPLAPWVSLVLKPLILASLSVSWPGFLNHASVGRRALLFRGLGRFAGAPEVRSEEHTSELQSLMRNSYAVFCLKKKHKQHPIRDSK